MRLSILLPTHNRADVLPFALESLLRQSFRDFEVLVVGDGCTDRTAEVVREYAPRFEALRWFDLPKGPFFGYANRNVALREARGELVGFMAHDDIVFPDHFERLAGLFDDPQIQIAYTRAVWVTPSGAILPTLFNLHDGAIREPFLTRRLNRMPASCFVHRRGCLEQAGYWDETLEKGGDLNLWGRIIQHYGLAALHYLPETTCFHFKAIWKPEANPRDPVNAPIWKDLLFTPGRLGAGLHVEIPPGFTEQKAFHRRIVENPEWLPELRTEVARAIDSHGWEVEARLTAATRALARLEKALAAAKEKTETAKRQVKELTRLQNRSPWQRLLRVLRKISGPKLPN